MPMSGDILAAAVAAEFGAPVTEFLKTFCKQVVLHIQTNAQISGPCVGLANGGGPVTGVAVIPPGSIT
jgi:hypothetical protein